MKRFFAALLSLSLLLCACASTPEEPSSETTLPSTTTPIAPTTTPETTAPQVVYEAPMVALSMPVSNIETHADDGKLICTHATQAFSLILPVADAAQSIMNDFSFRTGSGSNAAKLVHDAAVADYKGQEDWMPYVYSNLYSPTRLDQSILSLFGTQMVFDGSAGSATVNISVTYDLLTGNVIEEITQILLADYSADELCRLIYEQLADLDSEDLLYADYKYTISDMFSTNTPVKNWYFSRNGLCFYFMPYELAPHSVGTIITEIPYSSLNGLLQDKYFPAESVDLYGVPVVQLYSDSITYEQIAELTISGQAEEYALCAQGALFDVQIRYAEEEAQKASEAIFSAASLGTGDAVVIRCDAQTLSQLTISYRAEGTYRTEPLKDYLTIE